jgi:hypothetical protein
MVPPTQADLDKSCTGDSIFGFTVSDAFWGLVAHWACKRDDCAKNPSEVHSRRCNLLSGEVATDAPLGIWRRIDESETLVGCKAAQEKYEETQSQTFDQEFARNEAKQELLDEGRRNPSSAEVTARAREMALFSRTWAMSAKCIASDDPRLREK